MAKSTTKFRIKKSRSIQMRGGQSWVGIELEREFPDAESAEAIRETIEEADSILKNEERKEREILEDRAMGGF